MFCILRFYLKLTNLSYKSYPFQLSYSSTNWFINPFNKIFPAKSQFDLPSVLVAVISSFSFAFFLYFNSVFAVTSTFKRNINILEVLIYIFLLPVLWILDWVFSLVIVLLIISVLTSFIISSSVSELKNTIYLLSDNFKASKKKLISTKFSRDIKFDFSPLIIFIIVEILFLINKRFIEELTYTLSKI